MPLGRLTKPLVALAVLSGMLLPSWTAAQEPARSKVAIVVGPVGAELTPVYLELAEMAAAAAERGGAEVARAYSPQATPERVLEAVAGANIVVYFGHGTGFPNPYSDVLNPQTVNGWALQGPNADGTHTDTLGDGRLRYHGEAWLEANARPAPGFVMIYSNACYAPGASEAGLAQPTEEEALAHVANYSRPILAMGASAYYATDFYAGAATLVDELLARRRTSVGEVFQAEPRFEPEALTRRPHPLISGAEVWLHRSIYLEGKLDYWYAFAGDPDAAPLGARTAVPAPAAAEEQPEQAVAGRANSLVAGLASSYPFTPGMEGRPTVALPLALGGRATLSVNGWVAVCGDRCVVLPVVDSCPCYWGTSDQRVANLSHAAWALISDMPLAEGLIPVRLYVDGKVPPGEAPTPLTLRTTFQAPIADEGRSAPRRAGTSVPMGVVLEY